jgi:phage baseplate assembly protein W
MVKNNIVYSDFDVTFRRNALTGDVIRKNNVDDIRQSLFLLFQTNFYERKWHPEIGSYIPKMLFNQDDGYIKDVLRDQIVTLIENYEPRITIDNIWIGHENLEDVFHGKVTIKISYTINIINYKDTYIYTITRLR